MVVFMFLIRLKTPVASPFEVLSVDRDADLDEVTRAYRERVKEAHPDHGGSKREFQRVRAAYEELKDGVDIEAGDSDADERASASARAQSEARAGESEDTADRQDRCRVEYLDYEVLDDHGWDLDDPDLFEAAAETDLSTEDYGQFWVRPRESILEAAERRGFAWPFACRGGACANCAIYVASGEMHTRVDHVLPQEMLDRSFQLSCNGLPTSDEMQVVFNVKYVPDLEELLLPPRPFEQAHVDD